MSKVGLFNCYDMGYVTLCEGSTRTCTSLTLLLRTLTPLRRKYRFTFTPAPPEQTLDAALYNVPDDNFAPHRNGDCRFFDVPKTGQAMLVVRI